MEEDNIPGKLHKINFRLSTPINLEGLKKKLSITTALSLTTPPPETQFVFHNFSFILFSIIVQGLTVGKLIKRFF